MTNKAVLELPPTPSEIPAKRGSSMVLVVYLVVALLLIGAGVAFWMSRERVAIRWRQARAASLLRDRKDLQALSELRTVLGRDLQNPETLLMLARVHRRMGNVPRAAVFLDRASEFGADPLKIHREKQMIQAQTGDLAEVEPYLPELMVNAGEDGPDICQAFVQGFFSNARTKDALDLLDAWEQSYPQDPEPLFMRAYLKQSMSNPDQAIALYRQGLAMAPERTAMRMRLAETLISAHQFDKAEQELAICLNEAPQDSQVHYVAAQCALERGEADQARQRVVKALSLDPHLLDARRLKGQLDFDRGALDEAVKELEEVARQRPYDTVNRDALGRTLRALGRSDEAKIHFDYVSTAESKIREVERLVRESLQQPINADLRYQIGTILLQYGPPDDGVKWLRAALQVQPDHAGANEALKMFFEGRGNLAPAKNAQQNVHATLQ